ncbi:MAG: MtnX-like HAD-IB family phosphatase [Dehalococcoidales bacterium]|nr:MtnX-like HAD-IB family phosphatase [Dehalococcoidales bacterium]
MKTLFQCDFDGTITFEDISFLILDTFGDKDWRRMFQEYKDGKISVGRFNTLAFATVKADKETLLKLVKEKAELRPGLANLLECCRRKGIEFTIVSNGLDFYIRAILEDIGLENIRVFAARTGFGSNGVEARYLGPGGKDMEEGFKEAHLKMFQESGYRVIYAGNGTSDAPPAQQAYHIFATGDLLAYFRKRKVACTPFDDLNDIANGLELLPL